MINLDAGQGSNPSKRIISVQKVDNRIFTVSFKETFNHQNNNIKQEEKDGNVL